MSKINKAGPVLAPRPSKKTPENAPSPSTASQERGRLALAALGLSCDPAHASALLQAFPSGSVPLNPVEGQAMVAEIRQSYSGRRRLALWLQSTSPPDQDRAACAHIAELSSSFSHCAGRTLTTDELQAEVKEARLALSRLDTAIGKLRSADLRAKAMLRLHALSKNFSGSHDDVVRFRNSRHFAILVLRSHAKLTAQCTAYLRVQEAFFAAATGKPQQCLWQAPGEDVRPLGAAELTKKPPPRWANLKEMVQSAQLTRLPVAQARDLLAAHRKIGPELFKEPEFTKLTLQVDELHLTYEQADVGTCSYVDPSEHVLPEVLAARALSGVEAALPTQAAWTQREHEMIQSLCKLAEQAAHLDRISRADGTLWLQVASLVEHEPEIVCLARAIHAQVAELHARHFDRAEELASQAAPSKAGRKKARGRPAKPATDESSSSPSSSSSSSSSSSPSPSPSLPATASTASSMSSVRAARQACQSVTVTEVEPSTAIQPVWQVVERSHRKPRWVTLHPGVALLSALSEQRLRHLLESKVDPSTFATPSAPRWLGAARSLAYHMEKHAASGVPAEEFLQQAMATYQPNLAQMQPRSDRLLGHVMVMHNPQYYAVFSMQGLFITFCERAVCGADHYPSLKANAQAEAL